MHIVTSRSPSKRSHVIANVFLSTSDNLTTNLHCNMAAVRAEVVTKEVFDLYRKYGDQDYIGEPVSQKEHMIQCAMLAEKEGYSDEVVLGVFLHDIGHLIGFHKALPCMGDVGTQAHEIVGEQFLKDLGFPDSVTSFVRGHVDAKRYLVYKYPYYHSEVQNQMVYFRPCLAVRNIDRILAKIFYKLIEYVQCLFRNAKRL